VNDNGENIDGKVPGNVLRRSVRPAGIAERRYLAQ